jgi:hypothetical protein
MVADIVYLDLSRTAGWAAAHSQAGYCYEPR